MAPVNTTRPGILSALANGDMTRDELAEELRARIPTVQYNLRILLESGQIHIVEWLPPIRQGLRSPVYRIGAGKSKKMTRRSKEEIMASQLEWQRRKRMQLRIASAQGNPFAVVMAQI